jgi:hypothetical protein
LHDFLDQQIRGRASICYFNYRQSGERIGRALIGLDFSSAGWVKLLKRHLPYHESDHVLNLAYNALLDGQRLEDIELRYKQADKHHIVMRIELRKYRGSFNTLKFAEPNRSWVRVTTAD